MYRTFRWLSFFSSHDSKINEFGIFKKFEGEKIKYYILNNPDSFDSLTELVEFYCRFPLKGPKFEQILTTPIPKKVGYALATHCPLFSLCDPSLFFKEVDALQPWFNDVSREEAETLLMRVGKNGASLVRPSSQGLKDGKKSWALSVR